MSEPFEHCPICGNPKPLRSKCPRCTTVDFETTVVSAPEQSLVDSLATLLPANIRASLVRDGQQQDLATRKTRIGRGTSNEIALPEDNFCSRNHALISFEDNEFWLADLGSTNGTLLNGHPVTTRQVLAGGDRIRAGHTELVFNLERL